jgi:hypothetical protein
MAEKSLMHVFGVSSSLNSGLMVAEFVRDLVLVDANDLAGMEDIFHSDGMACEVSVTDKIEDFQISGEDDYQETVIPFGSQKLKAQLLDDMDEDCKLRDQACQDQATLPVCLIG